MEIIRINHYQFPTLLFFGLILFIVQIGMVKTFGSFANLLLIYALVLASQRSDKDAFIAALIFGVLADFASGLVDGIFIVSYVITLLPVYFVFNHGIAEKESTALRLLALLGFSLWFYLAAYLVVFLFERFGLIANFQYWLNFKQITPQFIYNVLLLYPVYYYYQLILKFTSNETRPVQR